MPKYHVKRHVVTQPPDQSYKLIPLTQGQNAIVDAEDFEWLSQWNWIAHWDSHTKGFYATSCDFGGGTIAMHRVVMSCLLDEQCDHENHDTLDNRKNNLRKCTNTQNCRNRGVRSDNACGLKGVSFHKREKKWTATICVRDGKNSWLGYFQSKEEASRAYDEAAKKYHGEFALTNHETRPLNKSPLS